MPNAKRLPKFEMKTNGSSSNHSEDGAQTSGPNYFDDFSNYINSLSKDSMTLPRATYVLYAISVVTGVPMLVGLILAYIARAEAEPWLKTHYDFLIRTFWYGLVLIAIGVVTWLLAVGMFLLFILPIWYVARIVRGWMLLENQKPVLNPQSWLWG